MFRKSGTLLKQAPISIALIRISFGVRSKRVLPPGSPHRASSETDVSLLELSFIHLSKSRYRIHLPASPAEPLCRDKPFSRVFSTYSPWSPVKNSLLQVPLTDLPQRETLHFHRPPSNITKSSQWDTPLIIHLSLKDPGKLDHLLVSRKGFLWREMLHL